MATIRELMVKLGLDSSGFVSGLTQAESKAQTSSAKIASSLSKTGKSLQKTGTVMTAAVTAPIVGFMLKAVDGASNVEESMNKVKVVFEDSADKVLNFSKTAATSLGMSEQAALEAAGTYGNLFTAVGLTEEMSAEFSTTLLTLSADLASFNNLDPTDVLDKLRSGLTGETEPLKRLGININQAMVEAKALELGLIGVNDTLTPAAKLQATYALILEQTTKAQGDFSRTSDQLANTQRTVKAKFQDLIAQMGQQLLPIMLKAMNFVSGLIDKFAAMTPATQKTILVIAAVAAAIGPLLLVVGTLMTSISSIVTFVSGPLMASLAPIIGIIAAIVVAVILFKKAWDTNFLGIRDTLTNVWESFLKPIFESLAQWLGTTIPAVIEVLRSFWENVLLPAIQNVWNWVLTNVFPIIETLANILGTILGGAIKVLAAIWTNILLPAITAVWNFISGSLIPIVVALANFLGAVLGVAVKVLAGLWQNVLQPALQTVWSFISSKLQPVFEKLSNWFNSTLGPVITTVANWFKNDLVKAFDDVVAGVEDVHDWFSNKLKPAIDGIGNAVSNVIGWFGKLTDKLKNIHLPSWLTPGSPTPLEIGLVGIKRQLKSLASAELPRFTAKLDIEQPAMLDAKFNAMNSVGRSEQTDARPIVFNVNMPTTANEEQIATAFRILRGYGANL